MVRRLSARDLAAANVTQQAPDAGGGALDGFLHAAVLSNQATLAAVRNSTAANVAWLLRTVACS